MPSARIAAMTGARSLARAALLGVVSSTARANSAPGEQLSGRSRSPRSRCRVPQGSTTPEGTCQNPPRGPIGRTLAPFVPFSVCAVNTIEIYSRQARNFENEMRAIEIRIRAERRCGELLAEIERTQGKRSDLVTSPRAGTKSFNEQLADYGISRKQAERWQQLAAVPEDEFEATFAGPPPRSRRRPGSSTKTQKRNATTS